MFWNQQSERVRKAGRPALLSCSLGGCKLQEETDWNSHVAFQGILSTKAKPIKLWRNRGILQNTENTPPHTHTISTTLVTSGIRRDQPAVKGHLPCFFGSPRHERGTVPGPFLTTANPAPHKQDAFLLQVLAASLRDKRNKCHPEGSHSICQVVEQGANEVNPPLYLKPLPFLYSPTL